MQRFSYRWYLAGWVVGIGLLGLWLLGASAQVQGTAAYTYTTLDLPLTAPAQSPYALMVPTGITDTRTIAAMPYSTGGGSLIRHPAGRLTVVECPQSSTTMVRGVNNLGEAVGVCYTDNGYSSFVRKRNGTFVWVDYPGALYTEAYAINDYGHVVGFYSNEAEQDQPNELGFYGFLYRHGQFQRLYGPSPNDIIFPTGINLLGDIVGGAYANFDHWSYTPRGFLLKDGQFTFLDVNPLGAPGVHNTWARAINNVGQILLTEFGDAYLWKNGAILQLPPVEGFTYTDLYANGLNDFGEIVGWYVGNMLVDGHWQQHSHGFLATPVWHTAPPNGQASLR